MKALWVTAVVVCYISLGMASDLGILRGAIRDSKGAPAGGVWVHVVELTWNTQTRLPMVRAEKTTFSDVNGTYSLSLEPGLYDVFFSSPTISPAAKKVFVNANRETVLSPKVKYDKLTEYPE
jgi:hypothetical protein